jgi:protease-4
MVAGVRVFLRLLGNLVRLLLIPLWLVGRVFAARRSRGRWVVLRLSARVRQFRTKESPWRRLLSRSAELHTSSIEELEELVVALAKDSRIPGLLVFLPGIEAGWAACESLRDAFESVRKAGKQVVCYLPEGGGNRELFVALAADRIWLAPFTNLGPLGLAARPLYIRPLLDRIGVVVEAQSCGEYKSAAEPALRDTMSEPAREQLQALLSGLHGALDQALRERRGLSESAVQQLFARGLLRASEALTQGVVDAVLYEDELVERLGLEPKNLTRAWLTSETYLRMRAARLWRPLRQAPCIAVVPLQGMITGDQPGMSRSSVRHRQVARTLRALAEDESARAVVLYIDSPGGSALASELMHREIVRLARKKPVVAFFGEVAASGGYYLACACQRIVAQPLAITGSIGVVSAKVEASSLLERLGVRPQFLRTAASADMYSFARPLSEHEQTVMRELGEELYTRFLTVVAEGRKRSVAEIDLVARGRVWIARDAHARGLVDVLGGIEHAFEEARALIPDLSATERAALKPRRYQVKARAQPSLPPTPAALLASLLEGLPELYWLSALRHEPASYYAPFLPNAAVRGS